jgi:hypothetical protein
VVFGFDFEQLYVLLVERQYHDPVTGKEIFNDLTLMGNHIYNNEDLGEAAERILNELTGLSDIYLQQFGAFGNPLRLSKPNDQLWLAARSEKYDCDSGVFFATQQPRCHPTMERAKCELVSGE